MEISIESFEMKVWILVAIDLFRHNGINRLVTQLETGGNIELM